MTGPSRNSQRQYGVRQNGWRYDPLSEMGSAASKNCAAVFYREVLIKSGWPFTNPTPVNWRRT